MGFCPAFLPGSPGMRHPPASLPPCLPALPSCPACLPALPASLPACLPPCLHPALPPMLPLTSVQSSRSGVCGSATPSAGSKPICCLRALISAVLVGSMRRAKSSSVGAVTGSGGGGGGGGGRRLACSCRGAWRGRALDRWHLFVSREQEAGVTCHAREEGLVPPPYTRPQNKWGRSPWLVSRVLGPKAEGSSREADGNLQHHEPASLDRDAAWRAGFGAP